MDMFIKHLLFETPLHPKLVSFPIALLVSALFLELLSLAAKRESFHQAAMYVYIMAAFSLPWTALTGLGEASRLHLNHPVVWTHQNLGLALTGLVMLSLPVLWRFRRHPRQRAIFLLICCAANGLMTAGAYFGGKLVYEYGIGVHP